MKTFWIVISVLSGVTAVVFVLRDDYDKMFIAATLGVVAWFLSYRAQLVANRVANRKDDEEES